MELCQIKVSQATETPCEYSGVAEHNDVWQTIQICVHCDQIPANDPTKIFF